MNFRQSAWMSIILAIAAAGSFVTTHAWQSPSASQADLGPGCPSKPCSKIECCRALGTWLGMSPAQLKKIQSVDPTFAEESTKLERSLFEERQKLANLFDSEEATAEGIQQQVEKVIAADNALERRVASHLIALRPHLSSEQRARLYGRCAQGIREAGGCRWRCEATSGPVEPPCGRQGDRAEYGDRPGKEAPPKSPPCQQDRQAPRVEPGEPD
jgi:hypothetical protein